MIWRAIWQDTWGLLRRPWVWQAFVQTLGGVLGLWIVVTEITHTMHPTSAIAGRGTPQLSGWTWGLLALGLLAALACLPWLAGRFYDRLSATLHGVARAEQPQRYRRGFQWMLGFSGYWAGWALIGVGLIRPMTLRGAEIVTVLGIWMTLPWLLRWFGATFWDRLTGRAALRQIFRRDHYATLWLGVSATIGAVGLLGTISLSLVQVFGRPTWPERLGLFISSDVVLDLAMTCWYLALYARVTAGDGVTRSDLCTVDPSPRAMDPSGSV